ncbi:cache domain-containing protein [Kaarinaea lacus]
MKTLTGLFTGIMLLVLSVPLAAAQSDEDVMALVKETRSAIEKNADDAFKRILNGEHPFKNRDNPSKYVFILDTSLNVVAHPIKPQTVGKNLKGKPDSKGKMFRDEILATALRSGSGWVDYHFLNPKTKEESHKKSYFELVMGSDRKQYIVGSGKYFNE